MNGKLKGKKYVLVTNLFGRAILFQCFSLSCSAVFISTADVNSIVTTKAAVSSKHISAQHACDR